MSKNKKINVITKADETVEQTLVEDNNAEMTFEELVNNNITEKIDNVEDVTYNLVIENDETVEL